MAAITKTRNKWFIAYSQQHWNDKFDNYSIILPPAGRYYADPFIVREHNDYWIFFEDYDYQKGIISCVRVDVDSMSHDEVFAGVLETKYHMSYPCIFRFEDDWYMTPDVQHGHAIAVYKAVDFPFDWELVNTAHANARFTDTTVFNVDNIWYAISSINNWNNVTIFTFEHPCHEWKILSSNTSSHSRSAGQIKWEEGKITRPTQHCGKIYGHKILMKNITVNPYEEQVINTINPDWHPEIIGTHTINYENPITVIDGKVKEAYNDN